jgi:predicted permease
MRGLLADCRHAFRLYRRTPFASLIAVGVLAIGFAFVSAFLSLYVDLILRPYPGVEQAGRIVTIGQLEAQGLRGLRYELVGRMNEEMTSLDGAAGALTTAQRGNDDSVLPLELVARGFFDVIRPKLEAGRGFTAAEHEQDAEPVAVVSYRYWQDELGGRDVIGTTIELEPQPMMVMIAPPGQSSSQPEPLEFRIVGIMAPEVTGFFAPNVGFWLPFERAIPLIAVGPDPFSMAQNLPLATLGRRADGATARSVADEIAARYSDIPDAFGVASVAAIQVVDGVVRDIGVQRDSKRQLQLFLGASILLALVAAANVSLFLLARAPGRQRELGIRMAVGAPLKRLARQLASEAGLLVVVSAVIGLVLSIWLSQFLQGLAFLQRVAWRNVTLLDWRVLALAAIVLLALTALVSLAPVLGLKRLGIAASSRQVVARATLAQRLAGAAQIGIAGALGAAAIAFGWYLGSLMLADPGFETRNRLAVLYMADINLADAPSPLVLIERMNVERIRLREAMSTIPGIEAVAFGQPIPGLQSSNFTTQVPDPRDPTKFVRLAGGNLDSQFIDVLGLRLAHGRAPTDNDVNVVLVNEAAARELFGRTDVVGEQFIQNFAPPGVSGPPPAQEIIGVLEDMSFGHPAADVQPMLFSTSTNFFGMSAVVETSLTAAALQQEVERIAAGGEVEIRVETVRPLAHLRSDVLAADRARGFLTMGTAALVVLLAAFGFYGTQRYLVTAGRREYAIRASLGAGPRSLSRLVVRRGLMLGLPGLVLGALLAFIAVAWLRDDFVSRDISPMAVTIAVIAGLLLLLAAASLGPARQARQTQPAPLLRED